MSGSKVRLIATCLLLGSTACDPLGVLLINEEERRVPQGEVATFELLTPQRLLPPSARNVRVFTYHFQDTSMLVRFDAPLDEARSFAERMVGARLSRGGGMMHVDDELDWWLTEEQLERAESGKNHSQTHEGYSLPNIGVALIPDGNMATVWVETF